MGKYANKKERKKTKKKRLNVWNVIQSDRKIKVQIERFDSNHWSFEIGKIFKIFKFDWLFDWELI